MFEPRTSEIKRIIVWKKRTFCCYRIYISRLTSFKHSMSSLCSVFKCSPRETQRKARNFMSLNFNIKRSYADTVFIHTIIWNWWFEIQRGILSALGHSELTETPRNHESNMCLKKVVDIIFIFQNRYKQNLWRWLKVLLANWCLQPTNHFYFLAVH